MKKFVLIFALIIIPLTSFAAVFQYDFNSTNSLNRGLVAGYKLEDLSENASTTAGLTLTNNNSVAFDTGKIHNAASSTATNADKSLTVATNMGITGTTTTISAWFNPGADPSSYQLPVVLSDTGTSVQYYFNYRNQAGTIKVEWARNRQDIVEDKISTSTTLTVGTWYYLTLTYDGTTLQGFLNGLSQGTTTASGNGVNSPNSVFSILARQDGLSNDGFTIGKVDEVYIWNRVLTNAEITKLYLGGRGQTIVKHRLKGSGISR